MPKKMPKLSTMWVVEPCPNCGTPIGVSTRLEVRVSPLESAASNCISITATDYGRSDLSVWG